MVCRKIIFQIIFSECFTEYVKNILGGEKHKCERCQSTVENVCY